MTRTDARERREKIAVAAKRSDSVEEVAQEFGVSAGLVRRACREFGVTPPKHDEARHTRLSREHVVADLRSGKPPTEIARIYRVPEQKVVRLQTKVAAGSWQQAAVSDVGPALPANVCEIIRAFGRHSRPY